MKLHIAPYLSILAVCVFIIVCPEIGEAQIGVSGSVTDEEGSPLPSTSILLLNSTDSSLVKGGITDENGRYHLQNLEPGTYILSVSMVGFKQHHTEEFAIKEETVRQEPIQLRESIEQLGAVTVTARKPLFEQKIDRLVVNVQRSITSSGNTALEVLGKSPGVLINRQSNSISLNGKTGVRVMINDKVVHLPIDAVVQMLDGMSAANIEQIELITSPPAKYEAEGDAGLINIKMKEHDDLGYNGNIGGNLGYSSDAVIGGNLNFSRRGKKLAYFINYSVNQDRSENRMFNRRSLLQNGFNELIRSENLRDPITEVQNARVGMEYIINEKTTTGFLLNGYRRKWVTKDLSDNFFRLGPDSTLITEMVAQETNDWKKGMVNISLDHAFNDEKHLSIDVDYLFYKHDNPSFYQNRFVSGNMDLMDIEGMDVKKETPINIWVSRIDYEYHLSSTINLGVGVKGTLSSFNNNLRISDKIQDQWEINNSLTNEAVLTEKIGAAYISGNWTPNENLQINGGLRYEYADRLLSISTKTGIVDRSDGHLFPSLFIKKDLSGEYTIQGSYSRRITRPTFNDLAPLVFFIDPKTFLSGNSTLEPAISNNFKLDLKRNEWLVSLQYSLSNNEIARWQPEIDPANNELSYIAQNLDYLRTYAITSTFPFSLASWWKTQTNITGMYQQYKTNHLQENVILTATGLTANLTNTIDLPSDFSFEASGFYQSKAIWGMMQFRPFGSVNVGIQKRVGSGRGTIRLSMDDIFYTNVWTGITNIPQANLNSIWKYDVHLQQIKLTFTWNFGNNELKSVSVESGSSEEQGRVNTN